MNPLILVAQQGIPDFVLDALGIPPLKDLIRQGDRTIRTLRDATATIDHNRVAVAIQHRESRVIDLRQWEVEECCL